MCRTLWFAACRATKGEGRLQHDSGRHRSADREKTELLQELDGLTADLTFQEIRTCVTHPTVTFTVNSGGKCMNRHSNTYIFVTVTWFRQDLNTPQGASIAHVVPGF
jgi:hypothetical protein